MGKEERKKAQQLWALNKYLVLSKSHKHYLTIRNYLKKENPQLSHVKELINKAKSLPENKSDIVNAYQHIWGYFKDEASLAEKENFLKLIDQYKNGIIKKEKVLAYLTMLLEKYPKQYLQKSTIFSKNSL